ncbi:unnamed protein product [Heligmosomoides polygyrus]|uniref:7TM_GPCR_Srx domain-containing protein n=1 Tax=Heligmosomoides polygyrus TaxID=6339 RepID=A0A183FBM1_HELPZ|nr:unnamed protein product [Heligmosomoides polygyrus]
MSSSCHRAAAVLAPPRSTNTIAFRLPLAETMDAARAATTPLSTLLVIINITAALIIISAYRISLSRGILGTHIAHHRRFPHHAVAALVSGCHLHGNGSHGTRLFSSLINVIRGTWSPIYSYPFYPLRTGPPLILVALVHFLKNFTLFSSRFSFFS